MTTRQQDNNFADTLFPNRDGLLETAIEWIKDHFSPDGVFSDLEIVAYVKANVEIDQVFDERDILGYIQEHYSPAETFDHEDLVSWADDNGYIKE